MREKGREERGPKKHSKNSDFGTPLIWVLFSGRPIYRILSFQIFIFMCHKLWAFSSQKILQKKPFSVPEMKPDAFLGPESR